jgi:hypothetical protein
MDQLLSKKDGLAGWAWRRDGAELASKNRRDFSVPAGRVKTRSVLPGS